MSEEMTAEEILAKAKTELKFLINRRGHIKGTITRFQGFLSSFTPDTWHLPESIAQIETRLKVLEPSFVEFERAQTAIEDLCAVHNLPDADQQENDRAEFEEKYFKVMSMAQLALKSSPVTIADNPQGLFQNTNMDPIVSNMFTTKLPPIAIPEFSGSYDTWTQFHETFTSLIDANPSLSNVQKFYYLQSALKGDASHIISSLTATNENYTIAWKLLINRYQNKKAIIHSHIKALFNLPPIKEETHLSLRKFLDNFQKHFRLLQNLGENVLDWDTMLIYLLVSKLNQTTRREWEIYSKDKERPSTQNFTDFLTERCHLLESIDFKAVNSKFENPNRSVAAHKTHSHAAFVEHPNPISNTTCPLCNESHFVYSCNCFIELPISSRYKEAKRLNLCTNCLRPGHFTSACKSKFTCKTCRRNHHSLLHQDINPTINPLTSNTAFKPRSITRSNQGAIPRQTSLFTQTNDAHANNHSHNAIIPAINEAQPLTNPRNNPTQAPPTNIQHEPTSNHQDPSNLRYSLSCANATANTYVLLSTALVKVYDNHRNPILCKALLDSGSQSNFVSKTLFEKLNLAFNKINIPVCGINQATTFINKRVNLSLAANHNGYKFSLSALVIDKITETIPPQPLDISQIPIPIDICLADPTFSEPSEIDLLIGASLFYSLLSSGQISLGKNNPMLQSSKLGWLISGPLPFNLPSQTNCCLSLNDSALYNSLERFWKIEDSPDLANKLSAEETECESHFIKTTSRDVSGRFQVSLPTKSCVDQLGSSQDTAIKRFLSIERKFSKNAEFKKSYVSFMQEYVDLGHMTKIDPNKPIDCPIYYIPHHAVEKHDSLTTKLRVVFDASAKSTSGISLNDCLKVGPNVQNDLFSIVIRFRQHNYVLTGDIAKMYRQVLIEPQQRHLQRIVWRESSDTELSHFQLNTITYGTASASFLATRCLKQISLDKRSEYPVESEIIEKDCYVDDVITGSASSEGLLKIRNNLSTIFKEYGFELRKFASNDPCLLSDLANENSIEFSINDSQSSKTLGIVWNSLSDKLIYHSNVNPNPSIVTKRSILSDISQVFDPLGLLGPMIIQAKCLLQKLWLLKIPWDEPVPSDIRQKWLNFVSNLHSASTIKIPRHAFLKNASTFQLHGFSDASINAYGACIYIRSQDSDSIVSRLVCAKSRVAPLKAVSLPRLELCGALLLAKLMKKLCETLDNRPVELFYWTDSSIVLSWLCLEPRTLKTFACNRVAEIQHLTDTNNWYHIPSAKNPADLISRGIDPHDLKNSDLWWHGPSFLIECTENWPTINHISKYARQPNDSNQIPEFNPNRVTLTTIIPSQFLNEILNKYSSFTKLIRILSYCFRFVFNCKASMGLRKTGPIQPCEFDETLGFVVKQIQGEYFGDEIERCKRGKNVRTSSRLSTLNPFLDKDGILRVGGRLIHAKVNFDYKHPLLLPHDSVFTRLIIQYVHEKNLHPGVHSTLSFVRQRFWPINGKTLVKGIIRKCIRCFKANPRHLQPQMGDLPAQRVTPSYPFCSTGVDYAGPFIIKDSKFRNKKYLKGYLCIFICLSTKAVHVELATELTTQAFIAAFKRFVARRGVCESLFSDNGSNFVGANNEFNAINNVLRDSKFQRFLEITNMKWHFIPSRSPHFGGVWEAAVKSFKQHLKRVVNNTPLTYEELYTLVVRIEAVLNSRPLVQMSDDPNDFDSLTPGHFLIGRPLNALPESDLREVPVNRLGRYAHIQRMTQHFWSRWSSDYLHTLHQRFKWKMKTNIDNLLGVLVLIKEDGLPSQCWSIGRVIDIHPGKDNVVRVVSIKTKGGVIKRSVVKVCPLPLETETIH